MSATTPSTLSQAARRLRDPLVNRRTSAFLARRS
jgi:hypothetical protein